MRMEKAGMPNKCSQLIPASENSIAAASLLHNPIFKIEPSWLYIGTACRGPTWDYKDTHGLYTYRYNLQGTHIYYI